jgi:hypothetical protein
MEQITKFEIRIFSKILSHRNKNLFANFGRYFYRLVVKFWKPKQPNTAIWHQIFFQMKNQRPPVYVGANPMIVSYNASSVKIYNANNNIGNF